MNIPESALDYCKEHNLTNPRISPSVDCLRLLATNSKGETVLVPQDNFYVSTSQTVSHYG